MHRSEGGDRLFALATALASEVGITFGGASTGGASDGNTAAGVGRPVLDGLGPVGGRAHSPDEYIELSSIVPRTVLLAGLIAAHGDPALRDAEIT
jgi:glutamate carboxypeptidase